MSKSYASEIAAGTKKPSQKLAIRIYRALGVKLGPIADFTAAEINTVEKLAKRSAQEAA